MSSHALISTVKKSSQNKCGVQSLVAEYEPVARHPVGCKGVRRCGVQIWPFPEVGNASGRKEVSSGVEGRQREE